MAEPLRGDVRCDLGLPLREPEGGVRGRAVEEALLSYDTGQ